MGILVAILIFGIIITLHELGHFVAAKACGIKVNEFALGMGPRLLHFKKGETEYALRLFPIGGFCAMEGEDSESEDNRSFRSKKVWQRMIVIVAGPLMNLVLGFLLMMILASMLPLLRSTTVDTATNINGLQSGDKFISINDSKIVSYSDAFYEFNMAEENNFTIEVLRDGEKVILENVALGEGASLKMVAMEKNVGNTIVYSFKESISTGKLIWKSLGDLIGGKHSMKEVSGPVGTISIISEASQSGENLRENFMSTLNLTIFISINIGIFNLLPIPALDGGRLLLLIIEAIRRKPIKAEHEAYVQMAGMILLFGIMIFATLNDITRLIK